MDIAPEKQQNRNGVALEKQRRIIRTEKFRWKKGQSGNPKGRPLKALCLTDRLNKRLMEPCPPKIAAELFPDGSNKLWADVVTEATLRQGVSGKPIQLMMIWDRVDGKVKEQLHVTGNTGGLSIESLRLVWQDKEVRVAAELITRKLVETGRIEGR